MILGAAGRPLSAGDEGFVRQWPLQSEPPAIAELYRGRWSAGTLDAADTFAHDPFTGSWLAFSGNPIAPSLRGVEQGFAKSRAAYLLDSLDQKGVAGLAEVDGCFAVAWWDSRRGSLFLIRDRFGVEPLFLSADSRGLFFASRARDLLQARGQSPTLSMEGLAQFLTYCYLPGSSTLYEGVRRVPPGGLVEFHVTTGKYRVDRWYTLSFANPMREDERAMATRYRELLEASVMKRLGHGRAGAFLSGGMDSSSVVTFARKHLAGPIYTYGFRCSGTSFDESHYARSLARELGTIHTEVEYGEPQSLDIQDAVEAMEVPFCDVGIEIGTWLLSRAASGRVDYLMTGDGGDEIWASHPVYAAQRIIKWYDRAPLPQALRVALARTAALVKDSDNKRGLPVVLKRILPPPSVPKALGHFRWRLYHTPETLKELLTPRLNAMLDGIDPFAPVLESFEGYDGPDDGISVWLYSDYQTASSFYFSRLLLARFFGVEVRLPFYDRDLVEFGARIPAHLKLEGIERTKRLFRMAMEGVLPDIINHRGDKLGHSVPLKNWLRSGQELQTEVIQTLRGESFRNRDLIRPEAVERLLTEHRQRRHNHSHRLWTLFVLEHWLRKHFDVSPRERNRSLQPVAYSSE